MTNEAELSENRSKRASFVCGMAKRPRSYLIIRLSEDMLRLECRGNYVGHSDGASRAKERVRRQTLLGKTVGLRSFKLSLNFLQSSLPAMVILIATGASADDIEL